MSLFKLATLLVIYIIAANGQGPTPGIVQLDGLSFPKIVDGSHNIIVKFGDKHSYGEDAEEWETLGYEVGDKLDIIMAEVSINLYGEEEDYDYYGMGGDGSDNNDNGNEQLFEQYGVIPDDMPSYRLFLKNRDAGQPKKYDQSINGNLLQWIQSFGIYLGLEGCISEFDELVTDFIKYENDENKRNEIGKTGKEYLDKYAYDKYDKNGENEDDNKYKSAKYYIKVMAKIINNNNEWVDKESKRLVGILMSGNLRKDKEKWFEKRINILTVFSSAINPNQDKQEL